jgi:hypothetical protein
MPRRIPRDFRENRAVFGIQSIPDLDFRSSGIGWIPALGESPE